MRRSDITLQPTFANAGMITYDLSNRQTTSLRVSAIPLAIALPIPFDEPTDILDYARKVLPKHDVSDAIESEICVAPQHGGDGLAGWLGAIADPEDNRPWLIQMPVIIAYLEPIDPPRAPRAKLQWPGVAIYPNGFVAGKQK